MTEMVGKFSREQYERVRDSALQAAREAVGAGLHGAGSVYGREAAAVEIDKQCARLGLTEEDFRQAEAEAIAKGWGGGSREIAPNTDADYGITEGCEEDLGDEPAPDPWRLDREPELGL
ncbi:hypothetical protein [Amycolatopsis sacchari]|uniref:hypothetical protein n=1 Tax=Amycolatopsis sacchari TaxID=115433 RepID=UPI003D74DC98